MTRWINILFGILLILVMFGCYVGDASIHVMLSLLLIFNIIIFIREQTRWAVVYLSVIVNILYLWLATWMTNGEISFLTEQSFESYYKKALLLEAIFWAMFAGQLSLYINTSKHAFVKNAKLQLLYPVQFQFIVAITILAIEIMISSGSYFKPYTDVSDTGTVAYELGCLFLALAIVSRSDNPLETSNFILELIAISFALLIVVGSGKRLPFAFVIVAYLLYSLKNYGKLGTAILYLVISGFGYAQGIVRDLMTVDGINTDLLTGGFGSSNQGAVLHASAVYLRVADEGLSTVIDRGISFVSNFAGTLIFPISFLPEQAQINVHAMQFYDVQGNGGFIGAYSYFFLGWIGPFILAYVLAWLCSRNGRWLEIFMLVVLLTSPRWILYNIGPVLRLASMLFISFVIIFFLYKICLIGSKSIKT